MNNLGDTKDKDDMHGTCYKLSMIVPVYNNGLYLYGKAFSSLLRSSMFGEIEILLVDDGSTDGTTQYYVKLLESQYPNVRAYLFSDGGSGSASRPRNKGVELSSAKYIAFLDPDNEACGDGYANLYKVADREQCDLVIGNMITFRENAQNLDFYRLMTGFYQTDLITDDKKEFLRKTNYYPMSIQAKIIEKSLIIDNALTQVVGAVGQDSLFSIQLMYYANRIKLVELPIHYYYALRDGSTVNSLGSSYFKKQWLLEKEQLHWLASEDLVGDYMDTRFARFFKGWMFPKLADSRKDEYASCRKIVYETFALYEKFYKWNDPKINEFANNCRNDGMD